LFVADALLFVAPKLMEYCMKLMEYFSLLMEYCCDGRGGHYGHGHFGQNRKQTTKFTPINKYIIIYLFIEKITAFPKSILTILTMTTLTIFHFTEK